MQLRHITQSATRMRSWGSQAPWQASVHLWHLMHLSGFLWIRSSENLASSPSSAPSGQSILHHSRITKRLDASTTTNSSPISQPPRKVGWVA